MSRFPFNNIVDLVNGAPRFDLAESIGPNLTASEILNGKPWPPLPLGYGTVAGDYALRAAIAARHHGVQPDEVIVTAGGVHALFLLAFTLCEQGSEAVVATPLFPPSLNSLRSVGATVRSWSLNFDNHYQPDLAQLRTLLSPATRVVSFATPQNPSGVAVRPALLREIVDCVAECAPSAWLLVDETYREACYEDPAGTPRAIPVSNKIISIASLSKCHGAPGLRIGWAIVRDTTLREQLLTAKFNTIISCSPLDEALAHRLLEQGARLIGKRGRHLAQNLQCVGDWVKQHADCLEWVRPDAGALCCVRLRSSAFDDAAVDRFYAALLHYEVRVAPGSWFGEAERVFRLGFGLMDAATLRSALERLSRSLSDARTRALG